MLSGFYYLSLPGSLLQKSVKTYKCAFWNPNANNSHGEWQTEGCHYDGYHQGHVICKCNHLTAFAVLIDVNANEGRTFDMGAITILSNIALIVSIIGLICTIILLIYTK